VIAKGKPRHRDRIVTTSEGKQYVHHHPDRKGEKLEAEYRAQMATQWTGPPIDRPCRLDIQMYYPPPKSRAKWKQQAPFLWPHCQTPDKDNAIKAIKDAGNGLIWKDDKYIFAGSWEAYFSGDPKVVLRITWYDYPSSHVVMKARKILAENSAPSIDWEGL